MCSIADRSNYCCSVKLWSISGLNFVGCGSGRVRLSFLSLSLQAKRLEILLSKCKDTIRSNKERTQLLTADKDNLQRQLADKTQEMDKYKVCRYFISKNMIL